jgi:23S rRNA-/tRNA-specific pseudouridylate synthase
MVPNVDPRWIIHHDSRLIVLDKPSGLLAVPGRGPLLHDCLASRVQAAFPPALVVHRLDRDTSGLMPMPSDTSAASSRPARCGSVMSASCGGCRESTTV